MENQQLIQQQEVTYCGTLTEAQKFCLDNQYILTGYRIHCNSVTKIIKSLFKFHNESCNVWTHLFGAIIMILTTIYACQCLSNTLDTQFNLTKQTYYETINQYLSPVYQELKAFDLKLNDKIEQTTLDLGCRYEQLKQELIAFQPDFDMKMLEAKVHEYKNKIDMLKENFTLTNIKTFCKSLALIPQDFDQLLNSATEKSKEFIQQQQINVLYIKNYYLSFIGQIKTTLYTLIEDQNEQISQVDLIFNQQLPYLSKTPIYIFLASATACLLMSATYHLFSSMNIKTSLLFQKFDYCGVVILISGTSFPIVCYGFYDKIFYKIGYLSIICLLNSMLAAMLFYPKFNDVKYRSLKGILFLMLGIFDTIPMFQLICLSFYGEKQEFQFVIALWYYAAMGFFYVGGLYIYLKRIPEKWYPAKFDNLGQSHNIWHLAILIAIYFSYLGSLKFFEIRQTIMSNQFTLLEY